MKLAPFRLERYFAQHEFTAEYLLCSSDCESFEVGELLALEPDAQDKLAALHLGYTPTLGSADLRRQIAGLYQRTKSEHILVHAGAEEAIFNFMNVVLEAGDHVVVQAPFYQSLGEVARSIGAEVTEWPGDPDNAWAHSLDDLEPLLTSKTRVVVVNLPNNPTGFLPDRDWVEKLSSLSDEHGFVIFSDEVYRGLELDPADRLPPMSDLNPRAVSLGVMSKAYGLAGLRIGWIGTRDSRLFEQMAAFKDYTTICNSAPSEFLATLALRHGETLIARNMDIIRGNLDFLDGFFASRTDRFDWYRPKAGSIAFPRLLQGKIDTFCSALIEGAGVLLLPGTLYGEQYNAFRIGFGRRNLPQALIQFEEFMTLFDD